jgi:cobalamin biosynthesis Mg chelatase CobN
VLALLALACFPVLAQADSSGIQYSDAPPTATGGNPPVHHEHPAKSSNANGGASGQNSGSGKSTTTSGASGADSSKGNPSSTTGGAATTNSDGSTGQGSPEKDSAGTPATPVQQTSQPPTQDSGGSSPLVPILIAVAVLAAISVGVVMVRQRRQRRGSGSPVAPKAS